MARLNTLIIIALSCVPLAGTVCSGQNYGDGEKSKLRSLGARLDKIGAGKTLGVFWASKNLLGDPISDKDVEFIDFSAITDLEYILIMLAPITDRAVEHLAKTPSSLKSLSLTGTKVSGKSLAKSLKKHAALCDLRLTNSPIADEYLNGITEMENLRTLALGGTKITDNGLKQIARMKLVFGLDLSRTKITDAGLAEVAKMTGLMGLRLDGTNVTDSGILQLAVLPKLRTITLSKTKVTTNGKKALQDLRPGLEFEE